MIDTDPSNRNPHQDPRFLALKNAFRIRSGVVRGQAKGTTNTPYVAATAWDPDTQVQPQTTTLTYSWGYCTRCAEVPISTKIQHIWEPGPGTYNHAPNFGPGTHSYDDTATYYNDYNFYRLCGPGAADVALWTWPWPPNSMNATATDPWNGTQTTWNGQDLDGVYRERGYMVNLAWNIHAPSWASGVNGMMQGGITTTDSKMVDALNWEASGENPSTWQNYYYALASSSSTDFHNDVVFDIGTNNVAVVALLNANAGLPNWDPTKGPTDHFITILGYNDDLTNGNGPEYAYEDTCGQTTGCNGYGGNSDGGVKKAKQSQVWSAIASYGDWAW